MQTAVISYRVADFLRKHPPFQWMEEQDLLRLASRGRVKFHEVDECVLWQGAGFGPHVFVIHQGIVSLWNEEEGQESLVDIRGEGDMLGQERFGGAANYRHTARTNSDVVLYAFPVDEVATLIAKCGEAERYLAAQVSVDASPAPPADSRAPHAVRLFDLCGLAEPVTCTPDTTIAGAARSLHETGSQAIAVAASGGGVMGVVTRDDIIGWIAAGTNILERPVGEELAQPVAVFAPQTMVDECVLAMSTAGVPAAAITLDGRADGRLQAVVTQEDLAQAFGDHPGLILADIAKAPEPGTLAALNRRSRGFLLSQLSSPAAIGWLSRFALLTDSAIARRCAVLAGDPGAEYCLCFSGAAGRGESLTPAQPRLAVILADGSESGNSDRWWSDVTELWSRCGYAAQRADGPAEPAAPALPVSEWGALFDGWVKDPVVNGMYDARPLFDLRATGGGHHLWEKLRQRVLEGFATDPGFMPLLANDCLANLPPLTFFQDRVVTELGEYSDVFELERTTLQPLVDLGRVYGMNAWRVLGASTLERFDLARSAMPEQAALFRESAETVRILLLLQARAGIRQGDDGSRLPASRLSRHDRQLLKSGFRCIQMLMEFTAECAWRRLP